MLSGRRNSQVKLNYGTLAIFAVFLVFVGAWVVHQPLTPMRLVGIVIALPCALLLMLARLQLGSAFSVEAKASKLVTTGLYSRIRNPIYVFGGLLIVGLLLLADRPILLLLFLVLIPLQAVRIRREEHVLAEKFGAEYEEYKRNTWF
jgi:protein-S-isoprenylcysteine O-methyltransferase Ste14